MESYIWLIPLLPFVAFVITLLLGKWWIREASHWLPILAMAGSFGLSLAAFLAIRGAEEPVTLELWRWFSVGGFQVPITLQMDQLSAVMCLVVSGVGLLIFIYSVGYMHGDGGYYRFFAYMSLFAFSMLTLVLAGNYLLLYFGWEAVGLCSYYLIGFFYHKPEAAAAGKKAFIVNRVGDFGFGLGVMLIFVTLGTLDYVKVFEQVQAGAASDRALLGIALLLFMGAMGKSAQFPLHVWLPDAMEGPTPVSALIHAATMVTAGVYMVARSAVIFASVPVTLLVVGAVGAFTAIFAAVIGICQKDIKRVLAYSTVSQLGYMFMALGVGAWAVAIFHLVTHAFFKALLFLGAGSVIHALGGEQNMDKMGGLRRRIPATYYTLTAGALALAGIFPFAGFWSKDEILGSAWREGQYVFWAVGLVAAFVTAFYSFRMIFRTFFGQSRMDKEAEEHVHESPWVMIVPLAVLAVASFLGGFLGMPGKLGVIQRFLEPVFAPANEILGVHEHALGAADYALMVLSVVAAGLGIVLAWYMYVRRPDLPVLLGQKLHPAYKIVYNKFYVDEFYGATVVRLTVDGSRWVWRNFDEKVIDAGAHGLAWLWRKGGEVVRPLQTGQVQNYLLAIVIGLFVVAAVVVLR
ncbi:MAG: NADH-quinone oxidoreductase subunit L [Thermoleophilia bacterium]|nr:NADH-quinone oxidoreductase subunit L [Thermoleophilia bacterium]